MKRSFFLLHSMSRALSKQKFANASPSDDDNFLYENCICIKNNIYRSLSLIIIFFISSSGAFELHNLLHTFKLTSSKHETMFRIALVVTSTVNNNPIEPLPTQWRQAIKAKVKRELIKGLIETKSDLQQLCLLQCKLREKLRLATVGCKVEQNRLNCVNR